MSDEIRKMADEIMTQSFFRSRYPFFDISSSDTVTQPFFATVTQPFFATVTRPF
jgi:hypothetical protein